MGKGYFEVDKKGLAKLLEEKGKQFQEDPREAAS
jgi:hypothetical protein